MKAPIGGARLGGLPRRLSVDSPPASAVVDAVAADSGPHERAATVQVRVAMRVTVCWTVLVAGLVLGLDGLGRLGLLLAAAAVAATVVSAGLDRWGALASAGAEPAPAARIAARVLHLQAAIAVIVLPLAGLAVGSLAPTAAASGEIAAVAALALLAGASPLWWFTAHRLQSALRVPVLSACAAAVGAAAAAALVAPSAAGVVAALSVAFAWLPWAAWRLHRSGPAGGPVPGALAVPWHAALRAGAPTLARRLLAVAAACLPIVAAWSLAGPAAAGLVVCAGASAAGIAAAVIVARR